MESRSIVINWGHPFSGNSPLTNYIIEYREEQDRQADGKLFKEIIESKSTSFHMQRLLPHTSYLIRVFAQNALGVSSDCRPLKVTTEREAPSAPPRSALFLCPRASCMHACVPLSGVFFPPLHQTLYH